MRANRLSYLRGGVLVIWLLVVLLVLTPVDISQAVGAVQDLFGGGRVVVTHWSNGHMMRDTLLPKFAKDFNAAGVRTSSGKRIEIQPTVVNSGTMTEELIARVGRGSPLDNKLPNPVIVTPAADHWLPQVNFELGQRVVDPEEAKTIASTWIGIATYKEMAQCLGWPQKEIGFADIIALRADPRGWQAYSCAKPSWGPAPLLSYTDPNSSSTGRSMLFALYAMGANKAPEQLTTADIANQSVFDYVKRFQSAVDHYVYDTLLLNSKIYGGPSYGHFFFISESNLVQLYQGKLAVTVGADARARPLERPMVMIYPREGAILHNHSANIVHAKWVTSEQAEAAQKWIDYLRQNSQQQAFMDEGFRPGTGIPLADTISARFGLDPNMPAKSLNPDKTPPAVMSAISDAWDDVKKPGVVTFVVDTSGSMAGQKLEETKKGLTGALDGLSKHNSAGLIAFSDTIVTRIPVAPLPESQTGIKKAIDGMSARGGTALYDAIKAGIEMVDEAPLEGEAIRGVVVLTDGKANQGRTCLHDLVQLESRSEVRIGQFCGMEGDRQAVDTAGQKIDKSAIIGAGMALNTQHDIKVFFVGIGDADLDIGRVLAEGAHSVYRGATDKDLAQVLEAFGKHF